MACESSCELAGLDISTRVESNPPCTVSSQSSAKQFVHVRSYMTFGVRVRFTSKCQQRNRLVYADGSHQWTGSMYMPPTDKKIEDDRDQGLDVHPSATSSANAEIKVTGTATPETDGVASKFDDLVVSVKVEP